MVATAAHDMILLACKECDRQYDVTHLDPGCRVRCACDHVLTVRVPKPFSVAVHKCGNCGGAVSRTDESCPYCGAGLPEHELARSTLCPLCFTRLEDDARHCKSCGVEIAPQALTAVPEDARCVRCKGELRVRSLDKASVVECVDCEGMWVQTETFAAICERAQNRPEFLLEAPLERISDAEPERKVVYVPCLACGEMMLRKMFRYKGLPSRVVVDYCKEHGVWLDPAELERIVSFVRAKANENQSFDVNDSLGRRAGPSAPIAAPSDWLGSTEAVVGSFILADVLGGVVGAVLGDLFD